MTHEHRLTAILAADVVGYSRLVGLEEDRTVERVNALFQEVVRPAAAAHRGRIVKTTGDGVLAEFPSVSDAMRFAVEIQGASASRNDGLPSARHIRLRIGINIGEIIFADGDVFGEGVNIAARLEQLAEAGGIYVSSRAWEDLRRLDFEFVDLGEHHLKNIAKPVRVYKLAGSDERLLSRRSTSVILRRWRLITAATALAILAGVGAVSYERMSRQTAPYVESQLQKMPCSWLRVADHSNVDGREIVSLSGASSTPPADLSQTLLQSAVLNGVRLDRVETSQVAPLLQSQCTLLDRLRPYRYQGVSRFALTLPRQDGGGMGRADLLIDPNELGPSGAVYAIEPTGNTSLFLKRSDLEGLSRSNPNAVRREADGAYLIQIDFDHTGWNGFLLLEAQTPPPNGLIETASLSAADIRRLDELARAGGWRFELAWFYAQGRPSS